MRTLGCAREQSEMGERLGRILADDARLWGLMSAGEMVCHLRASFRMATGEEEIKAVRSPLPGAFVKVLALRAPMPWPHDVPTIPELQRDAPLLASHGFAADLSEALGAMKHFFAKQGEWDPHPIFGGMSSWDWMRWGYLHTDHHLRQFGR